MSDREARSAASTTGNPPKAGTCPRCGGQLYAGLTHGCTTVPFLDAVAIRLLAEHGETLRKLGEDD